MTTNVLTTVNITSFTIVSDTIHALATVFTARTIIFSGTHNRIAAVLT